MKSFFFRYGLGSILFLLLIFIGFLFVQPAYDALNRQFEAVKKEIVAYVADNFGLSVRYSSLSPSVLSAFFIKNIEISDVQSGKTVASIGSVFLKYNVLKLLQAVPAGGDITGAFSALTVDRLSLSFSEKDNEQVRKNIERFVQSLPEADEKEARQKSRFLPFKVILKNCVVDYTDLKNNSVHFLLQNLEFSPDREVKTISAKTSGAISARLTSFAAPAVEEFGLNFNAAANLAYDLSQFDAFLTIDGLNAVDFTVARLTLEAELNDGNLAVRTAGNLPFSLLYELDTRTGLMNARMSADNFDPSKLVASDNPASPLPHVAGSTLSGNFSASYDPSLERLSYAGEGSVYVSEKLVPRALRLAFNISGDANELYVRSFSAKSPLVDANFSGSYNFKTKIPTGEAQINSFEMPNGNTLAAEIFIENQNGGVLFFIPQLDLNGQYLTALELTVTPQKDSADFYFQVSDYSHAETAGPGTLTLDGSFLYGGGRFLQSRLSIDNFFLDSALRLAAFFVPGSGEKPLQTYANLLSPFVVSSELYLSTDFKSLAFNAPAMIIANTERDREFLILSCTGNESHISVSQLDLLFAGQSLQASLQADLAPDYSNMLFSSAITFNTVTYNFTGTFFPGAYLGIQGDYGFEVYADFNNADLITGSVRAAGLPVRVSRTLGAASFDASFEIPSSGDWKLNLSQFLLEELSDTIAFKPRLSFSGQADRFGLFLDMITYSDRVSALNGTGSFSWSANEGIIDTLSADVSLQDTASGERLSLVFSASNPEQRVLSAVTVLNQLYVSLELDVRNMTFARFLPNQTANNTLTASVSLLGTLNSPFLSARVDKASVSFSGIPVSFEGTVQLNDGQLSLQNSRAEAVYQTFSSLEASIDLKTFDGTASGVFDGRVLNETITAPFIVTMTNNSQNPLINDNFTASLLKAKLPDSFTLEMFLHNMSGTLAKATSSGIVRLTRTPGRYDFYAGRDHAFSGYYTDEGDLSILSGGDLPVRFFAWGTFTATKLDMRLSNLYADASRLQPILTYPEFHMAQGILTGSAYFTGLVSDPEFNGELTMNDCVLTSPQFVDETAAISEAKFAVEDNAILSAPGSYGVTKKGKLFFDIETYFQGWKFTEFVLRLRTEEGNRVKSHFNDAGFGTFTADLACDLNVNLTTEVSTVRGNLFLDNTQATISFDKLANMEIAKKNKTDTVADIELTVGKKAQISCVIAGNPILRALAVPGTVLNIKADTAEQSFDFKGTMDLRGGDFIYFSRSFYIREGKIVFNMTQNNADPIISFRAETRERDENGEPVRIMLSAENQPLSQVRPQITSSPPKSEYDLMALLGQVLFTDVRKTSNSIAGTIATAVDYGAQATIFRKVENQLRNFFNFDIFSLRTAILQNVLLQTFNIGSGTADFTPGNFFDNSTVYIGKYFGNALYADALLHLAYDKTKLNNDLSVGGLVFEPEIGLEMNSPLATIRWSLAPQILGNSNNLWVPYASISLSWKFSF